MPYQIGDIHAAVQDLLRGVKTVQRVWYGAELDEEAWRVHSNSGKHHGPHLYNAPAVSPHLQALRHVIPQTHINIHLHSTAPMRVNGNMCKCLQQARCYAFHADSVTQQPECSRKLLVAEERLGPARQHDKTTFCAST